LDVNDYDVRLLTSPQYWPLECFLFLKTCFLMSFAVMSIVGNVWIEDKR